MPVKIELISLSESNSIIVCSAIIDFTIAVVKGILPIKGIDFSFKYSSTVCVNPRLISNLLMTAKSGILKFSTNCTSRFASCKPEIVGSIISKTASVPVTEAIAEQPIPGGPSLITKLAFWCDAISLAFCLISLTSLPEFSSPGPIFA